MTKDKSLHLTPKQLGLEDNPMIKDADPLASDAGDTDYDMLETLKFVATDASFHRLGTVTQDHVRLAIAQAERK